MNGIAENLGKLDGAALRVGGLRLPGRAFLAPMAGITDLGMRRLAHRFGASLTVSEMVAAEHFSRGDAANWLKPEARAGDFMWCNSPAATLPSWRKRHALHRTPAPR